MSRRNGRILAVQALYAYDVGESPLEDLLDFEWTKKEPRLDQIIPKPHTSKDKNAPSNKHETSTEGNSDKAEEDEGTPSRKAELDFACLLVSGTVGRLEEIDCKIKNHLAEGWQFDRLDRVTLAILRMSVFTLLWQKDLNPTIVIDEAIAISKAFAADDSFKFINAILDTIAKEEVM